VGQGREQQGGITKLILQSPLALGQIDRGVSPLGLSRPPTRSRPGTGAVFRSHEKSMLELWRELRGKGVA
jgi:hypothetical protein